MTIVLAACEHDADRRAPDTSPTDAVTVTMGGAPALPVLNITAPRFLEPIQITDPPHIYWRKGTALEGGFDADVVIQPAEARRSPAHCFGIGQRGDAAREVDTLAEQTTVYTCATDDGERAVTVDKRFDEAWRGPAFYCIASWHWDGEGEMGEPWTDIAEDVEAACDTVEVIVTLGVTERDRPASPAAR